MIPDKEKIKEALFQSKIYSCTCSDTLKPLFDLANAYLSASEDLPEKKPTCYEANYEMGNTQYNQAISDCTLAHLKAKEKWEAGREDLIKLIDNYEVDITENYIRRDKLEEISKETATYIHHVVYEADDNEIIEQLVAQAIKQRIDQ